MSRFENPGMDDIHALLSRINRIAVLGLSPKEDRPSYQVAQSLQSFGYEIVPVRPATKEVLGETCYPNLADVPGEVDLANVFRAAQHADAIVDECIAKGVKAVWFQLGIVNDEAAQRAREAGLFVVQDRCTFRDYEQFQQEGRAPRG